MEELLTATVRGVAQGSLYALLGLQQLDKTIDAARVVAIMQIGKDAD